MTFALVRNAGLRRHHLKAGTGALVAAAVAMTLAAGTGTAWAANQVTLGSTNGTPSANICGTSINCTYVPFSNASTPGLRVPFDGNVTTFSVNAGSTSGKVELRVLRPAGGGQYTGAGTSPTETLANLGVNTFTISLPVKAGDVLGLDNDTSALMFDTANATAFTAYYQTPSLADGATAAPNNTKGMYRLLLSATVVQSTSPVPPVPPVPPVRPGTTTPPTITAASQSHRRWRLGSRLARFTAGTRPPVGTTFRFTLNEAATARFAFALLRAGRKVNGRCVAPSPANHSHKACTRSVPRGSMTFSAGAGAHKLFFQGRVSRTNKLKPGTYTVTITATNRVGQRATTTLRSFTIVPGG